MIRVAIAVAMLVACGPPKGRAPIATPREGISIAIYTGKDGKGFGVVDDRRWVDVAAGLIVLDRVELDVALPALVIESLEGAPLGVGTCVRERIAATDGPRPHALLSPLVRCRVAAPNGRHLVRVLHVAPRLAFESRHDIVVKADRATVATRYIVVTPPWHLVGDIALYDGLPGGKRTPRELVRGAITLDGGTTTLLAPTRELPAAIRLVFDGAVRQPDDDPKDSAWGDASRSQVVAWLELAGDLPHGRADVHVRIGDQEGEETRDVPVPADARDRIGGTGNVRLPLWIDHELVGHRDRSDLWFDEESAIDELDIAITNNGDRRREVWLEERLRPARQRTIRGRVGDAPAITGHVARAKLVLEPRAATHLVFLVDYTF